ncbi:hypothetical protein LguiB_036294 [Lonicera macranthoides]
MFMSIFSSFDAVCAESFGHKVGFSFPLLPPFNITQHKQPTPDLVIAAASSERKGSVTSSSSMEEGSLIMKKETGSSNNNNNNNNVTSSPDIIKNEKDKNQQRERKARFAPELDGLHCFETIVPSY